MQRNRLSPALLLLLFPIVGFIAAALVLMQDQAPGVPTVTPPPPGIPAIAPTGNPFANPARLDFTLPSLDGDLVSLADFEGQPVILNFWATWCIPCERELPAIAQFLSEQDDVPVISIDIGETAEQVQVWLEERNLTGLNVVLDQDLEVRDQYGVFSIPVTYGLDREGIVREQKFGEVTLEDLHAFAEAIDS